MLILPIVNKNKILNVRITLKGAEKIKSSVILSDYLESDIIVNGRSFLNSSFSEDRNPRVIVDFIRNNSVIQNRKYSITTKKSINSKGYDVYEVVMPPPKTSDVFDNLYSSMILDMQKETPGIVKSKYLSLKRCGFDEFFSDEHISKAKKIINSGVSRENIELLFQEEGLTEMGQILDYMRLFDWTIISEAMIPLDVFSQVLEPLNVICSKDTKSLKNYYNIALDNSNIYAKMVYISKLVYDKPYELIRTVSKVEGVQLVKGNGRELKAVA